MKIYTIKWVKRNKSGVIEEVFGTIQRDDGFMLYWKSSPLLVGKLIDEGNEVFIAGEGKTKTKVHKFGDFVRSGRDKTKEDNLDNLPEPPETIPVPWVDE